MQNVSGALCIDPAIPSLLPSLFSPRFSLFAEREGQVHYTTRIVPRKWQFYGKMVKRWASAGHCPFFQAATLPNSSTLLASVKRDACPSFQSQSHHQRSFSFSFGYDMRDNHLNSLVGQRNAFRFVCLLTREGVLCFTRIWYTFERERESTRWLMTFKILNKSFYFPFVHFMEGILYVKLGCKEYNYIFE